MSQFFCNYVYLKIKKSGINYVYNISTSFKTIQTEKYILDTMLNIMWYWKGLIS